VATLYERTQQFRDELLRKERRTAARMAAAYRPAYRNINAELIRVQEQIREARDAGRTNDEIASLLFRRGRLQRLQDLVLVEIGRFAGQADIIIGGAIDTARELGTDTAGQLVDLVLPEGITASPTAPPGSPVQGVVAQTVTLPTAAIERAVPTATLLAGLAPQAQDAVGNALAAGLAQGKNPRAVARMMREALGGNLTRALTISRTETLRAYREAQREVYQQNADVLRGQQWVSALDRRSCPACIALHGKVFPLGEPMAAHPNCRCTMAPATRPWRELGFGSTPEAVDINPGAQWFRSQPEATQRQILGPQRFALYRGRQITLDDLVQRRDSPVWGASSQVASIAQAQANAAARRAS
jgi:SPP1 gp7 family putative phage head morphogenesis protein